MDATENFSTSSFRASLRRWTQSTPPLSSETDVCFPTRGRTFPRPPWDDGPAVGERRLIPRDGPGRAAPVGNATASSGDAQAHGRRRRGHCPRGRRTDNGEGDVSRGQNRRGLQIREELGPRRRHGEQPGTARPKKRRAEAVRRRMFAFVCIKK